MKRSTTTFSDITFSTDQQDPTRTAFSVEKLIIFRGFFRGCHICHLHMFHEFRLAAETSGAD